MFYKKSVINYMNYFLTSNIKYVFIEICYLICLILFYKMYYVNYIP